MCFPFRAINSLMLIEDERDFSMKIGIIGLGDIAQKAYLPIITQHSDVELVFCTRNSEVLNQLARRYRGS